MNPDAPTDELPRSVPTQQSWLNQWASAALRINHLNTLVQQAMRDGSLERARALSARAQTAAWSLFNQLLVAGAENAACDPEYPFVYWHRGLACEALGYNEEARNFFDTFGQCLIDSNKAPPTHLVEQVREKLRQYDLDKLYVI